MTTDAEALYKAGVQHLPGLAFALLQFEALVLETIDGKINKILMNPTSYWARQEYKIGDSEIYLPLSKNSRGYGIENLQFWFGKTIYSEKSDTVSVGISVTSDNVRLMIGVHFNNIISKREKLKHILDTKNVGSGQVVVIHEGHITDHLDDLDKAISDLLEHVGNKMLLIGDFADSENI